MTKNNKLNVRKRILRLTSILLLNTTFVFHLITLRNKGNNKITELRTILQRESQNS